MENAKFCLHRKPAFVSSKNAPVLCDDPATASVEPNYSPNFENLPCDQYTVNAPLGPSTVYVVVADAGEEGVAAVSFGVDYFGSDPDGMPATGDETGILSSRTTFTMCANGLAFPDDNGYGDFQLKGEAYVSHGTHRRLVKNRRSVRMEFMQSSEASISMHILPRI